MRNLRLSLLGRLIAVGLLTVAVGSGCSGCKEDEPSNNGNNDNDMGGTNNGTADGGNNGTNNGGNRTPGVTVSPTSVNVTEAGGTATFTVVLEDEPTGDVTITLTGTDDTEGTVAPGTLTFSAANWDTAQEVTVTGVDDDIADGNQTWSITTDLASDDAEYAAIDPADVSVTTSDDDQAGFTVTPTGLTIFENGADETFTVVLNAAPAGDVTIDVSSTDDTEGTASPAQLVFTDADWSTPQTVTVTPVDDSATDGSQIFAIDLAPAASADDAYNGLDPENVEVTNVDDDAASVNITPLAVTVSETGTTATFEVVLGAEPSADVMIDLSSTDTTEASVSPAQLVFTAANFGTAQTVTVTGVDDANPDGAQTVSIATVATSADTSYDGLNVPDVAVTVLDDDNVSINVSPTSLTVAEAGATSATFDVVLSAAPTADVVIDLSLSDTTEATLSTTQLTFTSADFSTAQTVTVTAIDDMESDGNQAIQVITAAAVSGDAAYDGLDATNVNVLVTDDDVAGITVSPTSGLTTDEAGGTATFTIVLNSAPTGDVTIGLTSSNVAEGTVAPVSVTFTPNDWSTAQTITVTGVDDDLDDGPQVYSIITAAATSTDAAYNGVNPADVTVTNADDDAAGYLITPLEDPLETSEDGDTAAFEISLLTPIAMGAVVTIPVQSSDTSEGTLAITEVVFTEADAMTPQIVTVTGVDDNSADGAVNYFVDFGQAVSTDAGYNGLAPPNVPIQNLDNEAGITIQPVTTTTSRLQTTENGGTATVSIFLNAMPTNNVVLGFDSNDTSEGTVTPVCAAAGGYDACITFTPQNYRTAQVVTLTGEDDGLIDGPIDYDVSVDVISSDARYGALSIGDIFATNADNDQAGITVTPTSGLQTSEDGTTDTYEIVLNTRPTADVVVGIDSGDTAEVTWSTNTGGAQGDCTFTDMTWDTPCVVTLIGVDDSDIDGAQTVTITNEDATSGDSDYDGQPAADVTVENLDDDAAQILVRALQEWPTINGEYLSTPLTMEDSGGAFHEFDVEVELTFANTDDVTIQVQSSNTDEGVVAGTLTSGGSLNAGIRTIVFDSNGNNAYACVGSAGSRCQRFRVQGVDDAAIDGDLSYNITVTQLATGDQNYNGQDPADINGVTNIDDDTQGLYVVTLRNPPISNNEGAGACGASDQCPDALYLLVKRFPTTQAINIILDTSDDTAALPCIGGFGGGDCATAGNTITYVMSSGEDWVEAYTNPVDDDLADNDQNYTISHVLQSTDVNYDGKAVADVAGVTIDDDLVSIDVSPLTATVYESGTTATFSVVLSSEPSDDVTISITSSDPGEATVDKASLTFTTANWDVAQDVIITGEADGAVDGNTTITIITGAATSNDMAYNNTNPDDVEVTVVDQDGASVVITPGSATNSGTTTLQTSEGGGTAEFDIRLGAEPLADVTISFFTNDGDEISFSPTSVTFTTVNWDTDQTVTITGVQDGIVDPVQDTPWVLFTDVAISTDPAYNGLTVDDVYGTNLDDDSAGIVVKPGFGLVTTEALTSDTFTVELSAAPTADVTLDLLVSNGEATLSTDTIVFTPANWNQAVTVTVTGTDDANQDGPQPFVVLIDPATSADAAFNNADPIEVWGTNLDNDQPDVFIKQNPWGLVTTEGGVSATFTIQLTTAPQTGRVVVLDLASSDDTDVTVSPATVTFDGSNWSTPQTITATGVAKDNVIDDNRDFTITVSIDNETTTDAATTTDTLYSTTVGPSWDVEGVNLDDDLCTIQVRPWTGTANSERAAMYTGSTYPFALFLSVTPSATVDIPLTVSGSVEFNNSGILSTSLTPKLNNGGVAGVVYYQGTSNAMNYDATVLVGDASSASFCFDGLTPSRFTDGNTADGDPANRVYLRRTTAVP